MMCLYISQQSPIPETKNKCVLLLNSLTPHNGLWFTGWGPPFKTRCHLQRCCNVDQRKIEEHRINLKPGAQGLLGLSTTTSCMRVSHHTIHNHHNHPLQEYLEYPDMVKNTPPPQRFPRNLPSSCAGRLGFRVLPLRKPSPKTIATAETPNSATGWLIRISQKP